MSHYYANSQAPAQALMAAMYVLFVLMTAHAVCGMARTAAVTLPVRVSKGGLVDLLPGDYAPKLWLHHGHERKALRISVFAAIAVCTSGSWVVVLWGTERFDDQLFGWTLLSDWLVGTLHALLFLGILAWAAVRGVRYAHRYELDPPFKRLDEYLMKQLRPDAKARPMRLNRQDGQTPVYELKLPSEVVVAACFDANQAYWFELSVPGVGTMRLRPGGLMTGGDKFDANVYLVRNGV